jgi:hypothetical protein
VDRYDDGTFATLVLTQSGARYWCKQLGNPQGNHVLVNEAVLSAAARLIGAPVRPTAHLTVPAAFESENYAPGLRFRAGVAHGSLHLESAEERDDAAYFKRGENASRWAAIVGAWDWLLGDDGQWLYDQSDNYAVWSFDHGFWLGGDGGEWSSPMLTRLLHTPWEWDTPLPGIDVDSLRATADALRRVSSNDILQAVAQAHPSWGTSDFDLETLAWFLFNRRTSVADRLDAWATRGRELS